MGRVNADRGGRHDERGEWARREPVRHPEPPRPQPAQLGLPGGILGDHVGRPRVRLDGRQFIGRGGGFGL